MVTSGTFIETSNTPECSNAFLETVKKLLSREPSARTDTKFSFQNILPNSILKYVSKMRRYYCDM
jgi:hypothetical protein